MRYMNLNARAAQLGSAELNRSIYGKDVSGSYCARTIEVEL